MCYSWERSIYTWHGPGEEQGWSELAAILWTLLGLVVSIPSFVFLTAFPIMKVMEEGKRSELKSNGKKIYVAAFADALEGTNQTVGFPLSKDYRTGSDYFRRLFGQCSPPVSSTNTAPLCGGDSRLYRCSMVGQSGVRNQWFVVADCDLSTDPGVPFLISSNLRPSFTNVSQAARMFFHRDFT